MANNTNINKNKDDVNKAINYYAKHLNSYDNDNPSVKKFQKKLNNINKKANNTDDMPSIVSDLNKLSKEIDNFEKIRSNNNSNINTNKTQRNNKIKLYTDFIDILFGEIPITKPNTHNNTQSNKRRNTSQNKQVNIRHNTPQNKRRNAIQKNISMIVTPLSKNKLIKKIEEFDEKYRKIQPQPLLSEIEPHSDNYEELKKNINDILDKFIKLYRDKEGLKLKLQKLERRTEIYDKLFININKYLQTFVKIYLIVKNIQLNRNDTRELRNAMLKLSELKNDTEAKKYIALLVNESS